MPYNRVFATLWRGQRHAMVTPVQVDQWAQTNISCLGDFDRPKVQMLGVRGFPGNSICHKNSMLIPSHSKRVFIDREVDVVSSVGYSDKRWPEGMRRPEIEVGRIVTDLCVMDFEGPDHAARVLSLHPGVSFDMVQEATGFALLQADDMGETPRPTAAQLEIIRKLDPHDMRARAVKGNPAGLRQAA
jgi:glutaconate CoA-transferase subunit B